MTDPDFVAPVGREFLVLHVRDKAQPASLEGPRHPSSYGKTVCGEIMWSSQQCYPGNLSKGKGAR